jgi:hypothetical protein
MTEIKNIILPRADQIAAGLRCNASMFGVPADILDRILPSARPMVSLTAFKEGRPVGQCHANFFEDFILGLQNLNHINNSAIQQFVNLLNMVCTTEKALAETLPKFIIHRCGLIASDANLETELVIASDKLANDLEFGAVIVETTNLRSFKIYRKLGYITWKKFRLEGYDDLYTIQYKIL